MAGVILAVAKAGIDVGSLEIPARQQAIDMNVRQLAATFLNQSAVRSGASCSSWTTIIERGRQP
jgi:hypothetical protein